ncbi:hypothetical protein OWK27_00780 [Enterobacter cloacae complex sp. 2022EL-00788]|uniref:hypothetical protein n=1 Tax=Enterobacter cloacae complex sp. 2022EL-00788 TaxID=2996512 RepID=UPI0022704214|nr:hypothetical protein [Enterobacter cloacae complex sp. 2022EL-00788]MCY0771249.1 hypothetical protein [Enterobacter cloacae complex sp. 2022EL-00788]
MEADMTLCAAVLQLLCDGFGKDDPVSRREACLALCESLESYDRVMERLAAQFLLDIVYIPNRSTGREMLFPVLHYGTLKLVRAKSAGHVLSANLAPMRRQ